MPTLHHGVIRRDSGVSFFYSLSRQGKRLPPPGSGCTLGGGGTLLGKILAKWFGQVLVAL